MSVPMATPGAFDPEALMLISRAFDNAWEKVAARSTADPRTLSKTMNRSWVRCSSESAMSID